MEDQLLTPLLNSFFHLKTHKASKLSEWIKLQEMQMQKKLRSFVVYEVSKPCHYVFD